MISYFPQSENLYERPPNSDASGVAAADRALRHRLEHPQHDCLGAGEALSRELRDVDEPLNRSLARGGVQFSRAGGIQLQVGADDGQGLDDRLPALGSNIRDEAPSAIAVSGGNGNLLRNVMHARQDARVRWRIA
jgi:hypothetical protein